jgi:RHS repeat-associated protein
VTTYEYNALGQRTAKTVLGTTTRYAYDEQGHLLGEYTSAGSPLREYVWLADTPVLLLVHAASPPNSPPAVYFIHADQIDTPRIVQDNQYRNRWAWDPDGFGQLPPNDNPQGLGSFTFNLRMPGQFFDAESGLFYNHFRDYDPQTGRYIESDPIGLAGGCEYVRICRRRSITLCRSPWVVPWGSRKLWRSHRSCGNSNWRCDRDSGRNCGRSSGSGFPEFHSSGSSTQQPTGLP